MNIVFLDRDTLPTRPFVFDFPHHYVEYGLTHPDQVAQRIADAHVIITNKVVLGAAELACAPHLKLVALAATGYNNIDIQAAKLRGITVSNVRNYGSESVAEHAFMMMLALSRNLPAYMRDVAAGVWQKAPFFCHYGAPIHDLKGKTLVIFGRGNIGSALAERARAFGMNIIWGEHKHAASVRAGYTEFFTALSMADVVSLHCPLNEQTHHMLDEQALKSMKPQSIVINVGRGGLVDEQALLAALKYGQLSGAGVDVLTQEPPSLGNPLLTHLPNLIVTPHMAWASTQALETMTTMLEDNIRQFVAGRPQNVV